MDHFYLRNVEQYNLLCKKNKKIQYSEIHAKKIQMDFGGKNENGFEINFL
jgi:hypothetical protein